MEASSSCKDGAAEIVFFDLETTVPNRVGQRFRVLEFGAIVVCPLKLVELESFTTLIRPTDLSAVTSRSSRRDGITRETVATAPLFEEVADKIFSILNGRIWAGHNIQRFDCVRIREAFAEIGRPAPTPVGMVDSLGVLTAKFGKRVSAGAAKAQEPRRCSYESRGPQALCYCSVSGIDPPKHITRKVENFIHHNNSKQSQREVALQRRK